MTNSLSLSNSLADLSARIRVEHHATSAALKSSVEHAMAAGDLLIEAKELVPHGQWLPWLAENCELSERTAQLYMRTAKNREAIELQIRNARCGFDVKRSGGAPIPDKRRQKAARVHKADF